MKICKRCVMPDTRPRLSFDAEGVCAACEWAEIKRTEVDWRARQEELRALCDSIRGKNRYDCIVPVSGGKDSSYVADRMKNELGLRVLTVTVTPPLETELIRRNLENFLQGGYDNIRVTPNPVIAREINRFGFIEQGRPMLGWTSCLNSIMFRLAVDLNVPLIMFGEEGETEYGGLTGMRCVPFYDSDFAIRIYAEGNDPGSFAKGHTEREMNLWLFPDGEEIRKLGLKVGHWSYFEDWDPYAHYEFARDRYGMAVHAGRNPGTYTNYGQLDTPLYELHTYMMYLKFGFGRALQDACIDIRAGRLSREEAIELVERYDGEYPEKSIPLFCDYYQMTKEAFDAVLDRHANRELLEKRDGRWSKR